MNHGNGNKITWTFWETYRDSWNDYFYNVLNIGSRPLANYGFLGELYDCDKYDEDEVYDYLKELIEKYEKNEDFEYINKNTLKAYIERWCKQTAKQVHEEALRDKAEQEAEEDEE